MQRIDGHVHLEHGPLSAAYVEQFVAAAQKAGLDCLQILDHTHRFREFRPAYQSVIDAVRRAGAMAERKRKIQRFFNGLSGAGPAAEAAQPGRWRSGLVWRSALHAGKRVVPAGYLP